jgi:hypothetical protein
MVQTGGKISRMTSIPDKTVIIRLEEDITLASFDCGNMDLNDFLLNDAKNYLKSTVDAYLPSHSRN